MNFMDDMSSSTPVGCSCYAQWREINGAQHIDLAKHRKMSVSVSEGMATGAAADDALMKASSYARARILMILSLMEP
jgi:hypothetical protein